MAHWYSLPGILSYIMTGETPTIEELIGYQPLNPHENLADVDDAGTSLSNLGGVSTGTFTTQLALKQDLIGFTPLDIAGSNTMTSNLDLGSNAIVNVVSASGAFFETNSFTPTITFATPGDLSTAYTEQFGQYTIIGNMAFVRLRVIFTPTFSTSTGNFYLQGFPVTTTAATTIASGSGTISNIIGFTWPAGVSDVCISPGGTDGYAVIKGSGPSISTTNFTVSELTSGASHTLAGLLLYVYYD